MTNIFDFTGNQRGTRLATVHDVVIVGAHNGDKIAHYQRAPAGDYSKHNKRYTLKPADFGVSAICFCLYRHRRYQWFYMTNDEVTQ